MSDLALTPFIAWVEEHRLPDFRPVLISQELEVHRPPDFRVVLVHQENWEVQRPLPTMPDFAHVEFPAIPMPVSPSVHADHAPLAGQRQ